MMNHSLSSDFYHKYFSVNMKRFMFCLITRIPIEEFDAFVKECRTTVYSNVSTKNDAYYFCKKWEIKADKLTPEFHNSLTEKEKAWLTEALFLSKDYIVTCQSWFKYLVHDNYHAIVYNQHPPFNKIGSISWREIITCLWKWMLLARKQKAVFSQN